MWRNDDVRANVTGRGEPFEVLADRATSNVFALLGTPAAVGRTFTTISDVSRVEPEVVLGHELWQRRFGRDPRAIGQSIVTTIVFPIAVGMLATYLPARRAMRADPMASLRAD